MQVKIQTSLQRWGLRVEVTKLFSSLPLPLAADFWSSRSWFQQPPSSRPPASWPKSTPLWSFSTSPHVFLTGLPSIPISSVYICSVCLPARDRSSVREGTVTASLWFWPHSVDPRNEWKGLTGSSALPITQARALSVPLHSFFLTT